ncbi:MAG: FKBP-type peptidyl-prolyl cis-trans isomerase [Bradymonadia bacterium]
MRLLVILSIVLFPLLGCESSSSSSNDSLTPAPNDVSGIPQNATKVVDGIAYRVLKRGSSKHKPKMDSTVVVHYTGWTTDGRSFDSSITRGEPSKFGVSTVISGWTQALLLMAVGDKFRIWVPEELAYRGQQGMPKGMLVFDLELLDIVGTSAGAGNVQSSTPQAPNVEVVPVHQPRDAIHSSTTPSTDQARGMSPPSEAVGTPSGLFSKVLRAGVGKAHPTDKSIAVVKYQAWKGDWELFDSTPDAMDGIRVPVDGVIPGLSEGLKLMVEGEVRRLWIPDELAYKYQPGGTKGSVVFDVELVGIEAQRQPPPTPVDVSSPPADAEQTSNGVFHRRLQAGNGNVKPKPQSVVKVHYTGWTTDGKIFDSSMTRNQPAVFSLATVIPGWSEGLQLMVEGEVRRLWIPESLAYRGKVGRPAGMLVFDVVLIKIVELEPQQRPSDQASDAVTYKKGEMGDFDPDNPPPGFIECHDIHCHHEDGSTSSFAAVMKKMGTEKFVGKKWLDPTEPPKDVSAPPKTATKTASGIAHRLLRKNKNGSDKYPQLESIVRFHFSGWTKKGQSFLSSVLAGSEVKLPLVALQSEGLIESLQLMSIGEKRRFWIPDALVGRDKGLQVPAGDLTFDIELIGIE